MLQLITLLLTSSLTVMAGATIAPALPQIEQFFQASSEAGFWVRLMLTMPGLFTALSAPLSGVLADRLGRKPLLLGATLLYGAAGSSGLVLSSLSGLLIGRALLGLAVGALMTTSTALIADYYQGPRRNQVMGVQAAFMSFGGVVFLVLGGLLADIGWRFPFLIYSLAFIAFGMVLLFIVEPPKLVADAAAATATAAPWAQLAAVYALVFIAMVTFYLVPVQLPFYLQQLSNGQTTNTQAGVAIGMLNLASAVVSTRYRKIRTRFSFAAITGGGFLGMALGYSVIAAAQSYSGVLLGLLVAGMGLGLLVPNLNVWVNAIAPVHLRGRAIGGLTTCLFLGQFASPILTQPLLAWGIARTYSIVALVLAGIGMAMLVLAWRKRSA